MRITRIIAVLLIAASLILSACASPITVPQQPTSPAPTQQVPTSPSKTTPAPTQTPTQTPTQQSAELSLKIVSVTSPVSPGANATLVAQTVPGANCDIDVYYKSGASTAQGLYAKTADSSGRVSWTWKVGTRTTPGNWQIVVKASYGGKTVTQSTSFTVR